MAPDETFDVIAMNPAYLRYASVSDPLVILSYPAAAGSGWGRVPVWAGWRGR
jgi:hypothetical protein